MKIAITGHTRGIGQACAELLGQEHEIIGYSTSTGCDISDEAFPGDHWSELDECDVFINNAHHQDHQYRILSALCDRWLYEDKLIINNSTMIADPITPDANEKDNDDYHDYQRWKRQLNQRTRDHWHMVFNNIDKKLKVSTIYTGATDQAFKCIVDNPMIKEIKIFNK